MVRRRLRDDRRRQVPGRDESDRWISAKELVERKPPDERIDLRAPHASSVECADERTDARANNEVGTNAETVQHLEDADVCDTVRATARQHEGNRLGR